jgi:hypothetical protein
MKTLLKIVISLLLLSQFLIAVLLVIERPNALYFNSYEDMASMFQAGWIPRWIPQTATQIKESHDTFTNEVWMVFNVSHLDTFYTSCSILKKNEVSFPRKKRAWIVPRFVRHVPDFVSDLIVTVQSNNNLKYYRCDDEKGRFLAVDHVNLRAYFWTN